MTRADNMTSKYDRTYSATLSSLRDVSTYREH